MDELDKGLAIALRGAAARRAVRRFRDQLRRWGVPVPHVPPLVLDFGLGEFRRTGLVECWICNEQKAGYCGKYLFVTGGQACPRHAHRTKHETFFVLRGRVSMTCGRTRRILKPGDTLPVRPGRVHGFRGVGPCLLLEISKPCKIADNYFTDRRIPIGGNRRMRP